VIWTVPPLDLRLIIVVVFLHDLHYFRLNIYLFIAFKFNKTNSNKRSGYCLCGGAQLKSLVFKLNIRKYPLDDNVIRRKFSDIILLIIWSVEGRYTACRETILCAYGSDLVEIGYGWRFVLISAFFVSLFIICSLCYSRDLIGKLSGLIFAGSSRWFCDSLVLSIVS
jgi:hypothetical protein